MQSRRDQIHSYQFFLHRVVSGLIARNGDPAELPFRRLGGAALGSVMVAALMLAAAGVYGIIVGGGATSWRKGTFVLLVKDTGARYVYRNGLLHPVINIASARLVLGQAARTKSVTAKSLAGVPRGPQIGIPGAPDTLPNRKDLLTGGWALCTAMAPDGRGGRAARTTLVVGMPPRTPGTPIDPGRALLVRRDGADEVFLVWNNHRFPVTQPSTVRVLGAQADDVVPVAPAWIDALPSGPALDQLRIEQPGAATTAVTAAVRSGQVVEAPPGTFYLVRPGRLEWVTPLQKEILLASPDAVTAYAGAAPAPVPLTAAQIAGGGGRASVEPGTDPGVAAAPRDRPERFVPSPADRADGAACAAFTPGAHLPTVRVGARPPAGGIETAGRTAAGRTLADRVLVAPGRAALVRAEPAPESDLGPLHLVTDQGFSYALAAPQVARMLGYAEGQAVRLPSAVVARVPAGPVLDPEAAARPV